ncbi:hypothetical protein GF380_05590, partial [Candidatus Uhrbacteria bacterium]|nr:hypothetical protein [Candidatus Uhrbacteria bacterium]
MQQGCIEIEQYYSDMRSVTNTVTDLARRVRELEPQEVPTGGAVGTHTVLDGSVHTDTAVAAVSQGSLIFGNATPAWDELTIGAAGTILYSDGTDPSWTTLSTAGIAPNDAQYLVLSLSAGLTQERRLDFGANFSTTDNGANADYDVDLSDTGVGAGAYGNATNVATFTVDAKGRLTAAANVLITGTPPLAHDILGIYHSDTVTSAVSRGS